MLYVSYSASFNGTLRESLYATAKAQALTIFDCDFLPGKAFLRETFPLHDPVDITVADERSCGGVRARLAKSIWHLSTRDDVDRVS